MSHHPLVSVGVPVYNGARYLEETIRSVAAQNYPNLEIVAPVDRSDDGSWEILQDACVKFPERRFVVERNPERLGMAGNWNRSVELASGEFIKVMGQDDLLEPDCIRQQVDFLSKLPDCALVASACNIVRHDGRFIMARRRFEDQVVLSGREILRRCIKTSANLVGEPVTVMARAASFRQHSFNPEFAYYTDLELWLRIIGNQSVGFVGEPLCSFRVHKSACSWSQQGRAYEEFLQLEARYPSVALTGPWNRGIRWLRGQALIFARTSFYRIFG